MSVRIQRQRTKGWRMPEGAVYVGRPSLFGNPWTIQDAIAYGIWPRDRREWCVDMYRRELHHLGLLSDWAIVVTERRHDEMLQMGLPTMAAYAKRLLKDKDLVCWCPLDQPCHADVLLELGEQRRTRKGERR